MFYKKSYRFVLETPNIFYLYIDCLYIIFIEKIGFKKNNTFFYQSLFTSIVIASLFLNRFGQVIIILARTPEIGQGLGRILSCGARKPEQT